MNSFTDYMSAFTVWGRRNGPTAGTIKFITAITNTGGHYDTSTGQFICQYPGIYVFTLHIMKDANGDDFAYCFIRMNGSNQVRAFSNPSSNSDWGFYESSNTVALHLVSGDVVDTGSCSSYDTILADTRTSFSGFLLKAD